MGTRNGDRSYDDDEEVNLTTNFILDLRSMIMDYQLSVKRWCEIKNIDISRTLPTTKPGVETKLIFDVDGYVSVLKDYLEFSLYRKSQFTKVDYVPSDIAISRIHPWINNYGFEFYKLNLSNILDTHLFDYVEKHLSFKKDVGDYRFNLWYYDITGYNRLTIIYGGDTRIIEQARELSDDCN